MDFAPIHPEAMHNSEHTMPSLLAAVGLKKKVTGKEFITAFVLGQEILLRIGIAFRLSNGPKYSDEYHSEYVKGSPQNPFTEPELIVKFKKCTPYSAHPLSDTVVDQ